MLHQRLRDYYQRVSAELERARHFQNSLLPQPAQVASLAAQYGLVLDAHFQASAELAGDYWQLLPLDDTHLGIVLADFVGHGVTAALNAATMHALLQECAPQWADPAALVDALNGKLQKILTVDSFTTFFYGIYQAPTKQLSYISCGAMPPLLLQKQKIISLPSAGVPLGLVPTVQMEPSTGQITFTKHTQLLLYSDALIEAKHTNNTRWLEEGLHAALEPILAARTKAKSDTLVHQLQTQFHTTATQPLHDDLTLIGLRLRDV
jgi:sigma-B regulation protein RsbU (phosphoserine phosphatase)